MVDGKGWVNCFCRLESFILLQNVVRPAANLLKPSRLLPNFLMTSIASTLLASKVPGPPFFRYASALDYILKYIQNLNAR